MTDFDRSSEALALSYLTGQATPEEAAEYTRRLNDDPEFAALVADLEAFLAPLSEDVSEEAPPEGLFADIMAEIETFEAGSGSDAADLAPAQPAAPAPARPAAQPTVRPAARPARSSPEPWRTASILTSLAAAVAIGLHFVPPVATTDPVEQSPSQMLALLSGESAPSLVVIVYDTQKQEILAKLTNTSLPQDGVWQLWLVREGEDAPISLGLLEGRDDDGSIAISLDNALRAESDVLAVSLEPVGGSKQVGPSGPVLFTGKVDEL